MVEKKKTNLLKCCVCGRELLATNGECSTSSANEATVIKECKCGAKNVFQYEVELKFQYWIS